MGKSKEEDIYRKNIKREVVLSPFITYDKDGEIQFNLDTPCPRCDGWMGGEFAGEFECEFCGYSEIDFHSSPHAMSYILEGSWKLLRLFIHYKRLRWLVSEKLYYLNSELMNWYRRGRHRISITDGDYMWSWSEKRWIKFL